MAGASISGLASGLDTATIITQLMQLEAMPQSRLKTQVSTEQSKLNALQSLNTKIAAIATSAKAIAEPAAGTTSPWDTLKATSSSTGVTVTASSSAAPSDLSVTVLATATKHKVGFVGTSPLTGAVPPLEIVRDGVAVPVENADGTLAGLLAGLNKDGTGVQATAVQVSPGSYRLVVESEQTGSDQAFTLRSTDGTPLLGGEDATLVRAGADARISLGGIEVTSSTNTFDDVVDGIDITVAATATLNEPVTVTVARDAESRTTSVKSLVDSINAVLTQVKTQSAHNSDAKLRGILSGESALNRLTTQLTDVIYPGDGTSMAPYGIELDRSGKIVFDEKKFAAAYAADPAAVTKAFTGGDGVDGLAQRLQRAAESISDPYEGSLTGTIGSIGKGISRLNDSIEAWDDRLALRRSTLERTYTALETALSQLNSQSNWLSGQLATLPTYSG